MWDDLKLLFALLWYLYLAGVIDLSANLDHLEGHWLVFPFGRLTTSTQRRHLFSSAPAARSASDTSYSRPCSTSLSASR